MAVAPRPITIGVNLSSGTPVTVYTVPTGYYAKWVLMYLFNNGGSTKSISVYCRDASASANIYVHNGTIAGSGFVRQDGGAYVVMEEGDTIVMQDEAGSNFSTICTFELIKKEGI
jgi:hypothetical protein